MRRLIFLIIIMILVPPGFIRADSAISDDHNLLLFFSNDVVGETEPCG
jgi:hypothetical protein